MEKTSLPQRITWQRFVILPNKLEGWTMLIDGKEILDFWDDGTLSAPASSPAFVLSSEARGISRQPTWRLVKEV